MMMENVLSFFPFAVLFILFWVGVLFFISKAGGWSRLAERYRFPGEFDGAKWSFVSGSLGMMSYNNILFLRASSRGLYLSVPFPFKFMSPPLLIPWEDFYVEKITGLLKNQVLFRFRKFEKIKLKLPLPTIKKIMKEGEKSGYVIQDKQWQPWSFEG